MAGEGGRGQQLGLHGLQLLYVLLLSVDGQHNTVHPMVQCGCWVRDLEPRCLQDASTYLSLCSIAVLGVVAHVLCCPAVPSCAVLCCRVVSPQVISQVPAAGEVLVRELSDMQGEAFSVPTVVLAQHLGGEEAFLWGGSSGREGCNH